MKRKLKGVACGLGLGAVNGLFGGGGGMLVVPMLGKGLDYERRVAHATAIMLIAPVCAVSAVSYVLYGFAQPEIIIPAAIGNVAGGLLGAELLGKLPKIWVQIIFIAVMAAAGVRTVIG